MEKRRNNVVFLAKLSDLKEYFKFPDIDDSKSAWLLFLISVQPNVKFRKQKLVKYLEKNGIGTRQLFAGNILHPAMVENDIDLKIGNSELIGGEDLAEEHFHSQPTTDFIMKSTFWVGCFPALGKKELLKTSYITREFIERKVE
jgi:CDP-6-deoxy-D-xylo-4-hexulose-3-dehydrase